jgi:ATP-dependent RNA helicase DeaD
VAARGIDLPSLSLVIHVEIPRDAETLQHRSGRTGRAGRKGTAILVVPYPRRRRVEAMLRGARIAAEWIAAPSAADIRTADSERLFATLLAPVEVDDADRALAARLLEERSPEEIAAALVQAHRAQMPEPEELLAAEPVQQQTRAPREGFEASAWFRVNVGRSQNADPRWILPLLCRRGHLGRGEIGAIRIAANETLFEVPAAVAGRFLEAVRRTGEEDDGVQIAPAEGPPQDTGRRARRDVPRSGPRKPKPYHRPSANLGDGQPAKPFRKKGAGHKRPDRAR